MKMLNQIKKAILEGEIDSVQDLVKKALEEGTDALEVLNKACIPAVEKAGLLFEAGDYFLPELIAAGETTKTAMDILLPEVKGRKEKWKSVATFLIGTVEGDVHDIGKTIVASMLSASGFDVIDLGIDVSTEKFVETVREMKPEFVGLSALLTSTMPKQKTVIEALKTAGLREDVKVFVGGAPVTESWAKSIGADCYAQDAVAAVKIAKRLIG
jgi:corrinoid protein of di/trimethylamine methyltransferase